MRKVLVLLVYAICFHPLSFSQSFVSGDEARSVAVSFFEGFGVTVDAESLDVSAVMDNGYASFFLIATGGRQLVVSGIKNMPPVLAVFDGTAASNMDMVHNYWIAKYLYAIRQAVELSDKSIHEEWNAILNPKSVHTTVGPFLSTKWGQQSSNDENDGLAYNFFVDDSCCVCSTGIAPVGCVAVAMGQIMNYWKYPVLRIADSCTYSFDWCNMAVSLKTDSPHYFRERNAIARLLKDCADAAKMTYCFNGTCNSFAWPKDAKKALKDIFEYSHDIDKVERLYYGDSKWKEQLINNLTNGWPVLYAALSRDTAGLFGGNGGKNKKGGHAFVCDGYCSDSNYFHFNMGWRGQSDGWYRIDDFEIGDDWYFLERAIINIYPSEECSLLQFCDFDLHLDSYYHKYYDSLNNEYPLPNENVPSTAINLFSSSISGSSWSTVANGDSAEYVAHKSIVLHPGFHAEKGSHFVARIEPCESCDTEQHKSVQGNHGYQAANKYDANPVSGDFSLYDTSDSLLDKVRMYPNPCSETVSFRGGNIKDISIFDLSGKAVFKWYVVERNENKVVLDVRSLSPAPYVVALRCVDDSVVVERFIKVN